MNKFFDPIKKIIKTMTYHIDILIDYLYPHLCYSCKSIITQAGLCTQCWNKLKIPSHPQCTICSFPFSYEDSEDSICGNCVKKRPKYDKLYFLFEINEGSKSLIHKFKYYDNQILAKFFAKLMTPLINDIIHEIDYLVPVPIHFRRLIKRKYNQSSILANEIHKITGLKVLNSGLCKTHNTKSQTNFSLTTRIKNVKNSFAVNPLYSDLINNCNILLIDDVYTSGATINECVRVLKKAGAKKLYILTIARTL